MNRNSQGTVQTYFDIKKYEPKTETLLENKNKKQHIYENLGTQIILIRMPYICFKAGRISFLLRRLKEENERNCEIR